MPTYVSANQIEQSLLRLGTSRAHQRLVDFLIVKREMKLSGSDVATFSTKEPQYLQAISSLMATYANNQESPYLNPFGTREHNDRGYRTEKYPSNGTSVTVPRWTSLVSIVAKGPVSISFTNDYEQHLADQFLKDAGKLPTLFDAAVWYYRHRDISNLVSSSQPSNQASATLMRGFIDELGLTGVEVSKLFDQSPTTPLEDWLSDSLADPYEYLPDAPPRSVVQASATDMGMPTDDEDEGIARNEGVSTSLLVCPFDVTVAAAARPLVILTGPSGTGKSRSVLQLGQALETDKAAPHFAVVPVGADWTDMRSLLGFRNPFGPPRVRSDGTTTHDTYIITDTLLLLLRAAHPDRREEPHLLLLDEMNLSHVERYFSGFLSLMEANRSLALPYQIPLIPTDDLMVIADVLEASGIDQVALESAQALIADAASRGLLIEPNVYVFGTVNVDETTYMFSPKVLDRALVIELLSEPPASYLDAPEVVQRRPSLPVQAARRLLLRSIRVRRAGGGSNGTDLREVVKEAADDMLTDAEVSSALAAFSIALNGLYKLLSPVGFDFGYRTSIDVLTYFAFWLRAKRYCAQMGSVPVPATPSITQPMQSAARGNPVGPEPLSGQVTSVSEAPSTSQVDWPEALDIAILQKVLPKIHGNRRQLGDSLKAASAFLRGADRSGTPPAKYQLGDMSEVAIEQTETLSIREAQLPKSSDKLLRMQRRLEATGYVSFVE